MEIHAFARFPRRLSIQTPRGAGVGQSQPRIPVFPMNGRAGAADRRPENANAPQCGAFVACAKRDQGRISAASR